MIVDGRAIAEAIYTELGAHAAERTRMLGIVVASHDPVIESFVRIKSRAAARLGVELRRIDLPARPTTADAIAAIERLAASADGIVVQLPLPEELNTEEVLRSIPPNLDVDGINPAIAEATRIAHAPVSLAIAEILKRSQIDASLKHAVVVGSGRLVGTPAAYLLSELGARVSVVTLESGSLAELKDADIIVLGAGNPGFVTPDMIKPGAVLFDAGTSESAGKVVGDADPACASKCALFTPVPGGIGPIAVAMIFKNLLTLVKDGALQSSPE